MASVNARVKCLKAASGITGDLISSVIKHPEHFAAIDAVLSLQAEAKSTNPQLKG
jgi:hypothetical protein